MLTTVLAGLLVAVPVAGTAPAAADAGGFDGQLVDDPASLVNPFIGTSNGGDTFPGADAPFGMVQWSPDTSSRPPGGGYYYQSSALTGFSLTHLSGPGCGAAGDVPVLPTTGTVSPSATVSFSHAGESADAGSYAVALDNGVNAELTATTRTGMARFTFPATAQANLIYKLTGSQNGNSATSFTTVDGNEVVGSVTSRNFCGTSTNYTLHFDMVFDHRFTASGTSPGSSGPTAGYVTFDPGAAPVVQAKVGVSYVSAAGAAANLHAENPGWDFDAIRQATQAAWNRLLGRIRIGGGTASQQQIFYTALYHALQYPNVFSDVTGQYTGVDHAVHTVDAGHSAFYTNFSGWDTYRSQAQLEALVDPVTASDTAQSMLDDYQQGGMLPKWVENTGETYIQVGDPADAILADFYAFGARHFDTKTALRDMVAEATQPNNVRPGLNYLDKLGYLPVDGSYGCCHFYGPVSTLLEYNTADFALSAFASALGDEQTAHDMNARAQDWQTLFNPATGFIQPKYANGQLLPGFDPTSQYAMVEGDSYQYTPMVPFNIAGVAAAKGGDAAYTRYLDALLAQVDGSRSSQYAAMSNEPSFEIPWEYDYVGAPYKAQQAVRRIQDQLYLDSPGGLAGNDDLGTMSAWYVWSALGMFPETPGTGDLALNSPVFPYAQVRLANGRSITINAPQAADNAPYVQNLRVNGGGWPHAYLPPSVVTDGATLDYALADTPNTDWAAGAHGAPPSYPAGQQPAIGYTQPSTTVQLSAGSSVTTQIEAQSVIHSPQAVTWTASSSSPAVTVSPARGTFQLAPDGSGGQPVTLTAAAGAQPPASVTFQLTASDGTKLTPVILTWVAQGQLPPYGCPLTQQFDHIVPQNQLTATASSSQPGYPASAAVDSNCNTFWHIEYSPVHDPLPQSITLDLGGSYRTDGLTYVARQDGNSNGIVTGYNVYVSSDGQNFTKVATGTWADNASAKAATWSPVQANYVRLEATAGHNGYACADEINIAYAVP